MNPPAYPCPVCEFEMSVKPFTRGIGWKYECRGSVDNKHAVQLYIRTEFPESEIVVVQDAEDKETFSLGKIGEKTESLLDRVKRLSGKGDQ